MRMTENQSARKVIDLPIDDILPNRYQPRIKFDDTAIFELSESIKNHGVFQPIIVRPIGDKYEIIAGERRYKASVLASKETIPAIIMNLNDKDSVEIALIENVQRSNLTPIEEAISYKKILDMGYIKQEDLAHKLGKTQSTIANKIRLLNLDDEVQEALLENKISERHARSLLRIKENSKQKEMLKRIIDERLTVRRTDEEINKMLENGNIINENPINITPAAPTPAPEAPAPVAPVVAAAPVNPAPISEVVETPVSVEPTQTTSIFGFTNNNEIINTNPTGNANVSSVIASQEAVDAPVIAATEMNIDQIQNTAAPVFEEKPLASMEDLLKPSTQVTDGLPPVEPVAPAPAPEIEEEKPEDMLKPGKFFNFPAVDAPSAAPTTPMESGNGFSFNNFVDAPVSQAAPSMPETPASIDALLGSSPVAPAPVENISQPAPIAPEVPVAPVTPAPVMPEVPVAPVTPAPVMPEVPVAPVAPEVPAMPEIQAAPQEPVFDEIVLPQAPIMNNDNDEVVIPASFGTQAAPVAPAPVQSAVAPLQPTPQANNVMTAVNILRDAARRIEQLGFAIDTDEIDLENMYQLIIKIDK